MRNLTLRSLRVFEAAASTGGFSRAGELLGMTQSGVSQHIRQLEEEVGARLFDTQARPIRLTDPGAELLRHARVILAQLSVAEDALATLDGRHRGQIHVGVVSPGAVQGVHGLPVTHGPVRDGVAVMACRRGRCFLQVHDKGQAQHKRSAS